MTETMSGMLSRERHVVCFYGDDPELLTLAMPALAGALRAEGTVVVVATEEHRRLFSDELRRRVGEARVDGAVVSLDAQRSLDAFMVDGRPDAGAFDATIGELIRTHARAGAPLAVYGEMVGLLWDDGLVSAAIELEELWNELGEDTTFSLLCGYQADRVEGAENEAALQLVCQLHAGGASRPATAPADAPALDVATRSFACNVGQPAAARHFARETLLDWGRGDLLDDAVLIVSELTSNAVRHAASSFTVSFANLGWVVRVEVEDSSVVAAHRRPPDDSGGRGLLLVEGIAVRWGTDASGEGKIVWAELAS